MMLNMLFHSFSVSNLAKIAIYFISVFTVDWRKHQIAPDTNCITKTKMKLYAIFLSLFILFEIFRCEWKKPKKNISNLFESFYMQTSFLVYPLNGTIFAGGRMWHCWNLWYQDELFITMSQCFTVNSFEAISTHALENQKNCRSGDIKKWNF